MGDQQQHRQRHVVSSTAASASSSLNSNAQESLPAAPLSNSRNTASFYKQQQHHHSNNGSNSINSSRMKFEAYMVSILFGCMCFYAGLLVGTSSSSFTSPHSRALELLNNFTGSKVTSLSTTTTTTTTAISPLTSQEEIEATITQRVKEQVKTLRRLMYEKQHEKDGSLDIQSDDKSTRFTSGTGDFAVGMAVVNRDEFAQQFDMGIPLDASSAGNKEVLILYQSQGSVPDYDPYVEKEITQSTSVPRIDSIDDAVANCDAVHIVLSDHSPKKRRQCTAIMGQYEAFHIQKFMRLPFHADDVPPAGDEATGDEDADNSVGAEVKTAAQRQLEGMMYNFKKPKKVDSNMPLRYVARGAGANGRLSMKPPSEKYMKEYWAVLVKYLSTIEDVMAKLKIIADPVAASTKTNTIIVLVCNFGQSELLFNFICNAKRKNLDLNSVLVFATDIETHDLVQSLGIAVFYDEENYGTMPKHAARKYADPTFTRMMMAKVFCVHMSIMLGYDVLFQDVDVVWYKHPFEYFHATNATLASKQYDLYFQDDGNHALFYAPYSANTGFYYVRNNPKTRHFFNSVLMQGDLIFSTHSHQVPLVALLQEHASLLALKVKIFPRHEDEFPGGHAFHRRKPLMQQIIAGTTTPYIFHMSWTTSKVNKIAFFEQLGEWYVENTCVQRSANKLIDAHGSDISAGCCSADALFKCHYSDKPSLHPCKSSPKLDSWARSFWR